MKPIFLDTVGLLALWNSDDQWHVQANKSFTNLLDHRSTFLTTTYVLLECGNAASRRTFRQDVVDLQRLLEAREELVRPSEEDWRQGWQSYQQTEAAGAGIVDCISFAVMHRLGISEAFSNDRHFSAAGFRTLF